MTRSMKLGLRLNGKKLPGTYLGVADTSDEIEIKKRYWLLAIENHPDLNPYDKERENRFKLISEAYEYLTTRRSGSRYSFFKNGIVKNKDSVTIYNEAGYFKWWKTTFF